MGAASLVLAGVAPAQSLESRIAAARGTVAFEYATRPNVCGDGWSINVSDDSSAGWTARSRRRGIHIGTRRGRGESANCETGPARAVLRRDGSQPPELRLTVGGRPADADTELGDVSPGEAARYLLALAPRLAGQSGEHAVMGAAIADGVVAWPRMLEIARQRGASEAAQKAAVFWVSQEAGAVATRGLDSVASDDDVTLSVRADALFYLAQRPSGEGIPALVKVAESSKSSRLRKDAIFFLAQSRDSRALDLFERLLAGK